MASSISVAWPWVWRWLCSLGLWVYDEVSYNRSHKNYERIAEVYRRNTQPLEQKTYSSNGLPQPVAKVLTEKYGHLFKHVSLVWWPTNYNLRVGEKNFSKTGQFIGKGVIDMFSLKMLSGNHRKPQRPASDHYFGIHGKRAFW